MQSNVGVGFAGRDALELLLGCGQCCVVTGGVRTHLGGAGGEEDANVIRGDELGVEFVCV